MGLCIWTKTIKDCVYNCTLDIVRLHVQLSFFDGLVAEISLGLGGMKPRHQVIVHEERICILNPHLVPDFPSWQNEGRHTPP